MDIKEDYIVKGIPVNVKIDLPDKTILYIGAALFGALFLALLLYGVFNRYVFKTKG